MGLCRWYILHYFGLTGGYDPGGSGILGVGTYGDETEFWVIGDRGERCDGRGGKGIHTIKTSLDWLGDRMGDLGYMALVETKLMALAVLALTQFLTLLFLDYC